MEIIAKGKTYIEKQLQTINETEQEKIVKLCQEVIDLKARCDCYEDEIKFLRELLIIKTKTREA